MFVVGSVPSVFWSGAVVASLIAFDTFPTVFPRNPVNLENMLEVSGGVGVVATERGIAATDGDLIGALVFPKIFARDGPADSEGAPPATGAAAPKMLSIDGAVPGGMIGYSTVDAAGALNPANG
jgi:hypothetical protein